MTSWTEEFLEKGMVIVENALSAEFCEQVVERRLSETGVDESAPETWPRGWQNMPATKAFALEEVAPSAAAALFELVGPPQRLTFHDLPDNLIINFPDDPEGWWAPPQKNAPNAHWHKDGDWFRHFLDSPEQGMLGIIFWRDVAERQGPTYVLSDSVPAVARLLAVHPEGLDPPLPLDDVVEQSERPIPLTGSQGTIVWAHPFLVHSASVNATNRLRIISNTSVMLRRPLRLDREDGTPLERSILSALGVSSTYWKASGERGHAVSARERSWRGSNTDTTQATSAKVAHTSHATS